MMKKQDFFVLNLFAQGQINSAIELMKLSTNIDLQYESTHLLGGAVFGGK